MKVIYAISCGDKYYIGSTANWDMRVKTHKRHLEEGVHVNKFLQRVYNKHGEEKGFEYKILEKVEGDLFEREQVLIDRHFNDPKCMNVNPNASHPTPNENSWKAAAEANTGIKRTDEARKKMSDAKKEFIAKNPDFYKKGQEKGRANRYAKLPEFVLIKDGVEYGPYKQQQEAYEELSLSNVSVSRLFLGKLKEVKGFTLKFTSLD
jgi:group I intron endonuclease